ncbi:MAG: hypothetical protein KAI66_17525, partial [Lentisphaeria bacterium]|nr:hypothetical protein [Lentisphaeria bacterium]
MSAPFPDSAQSLNSQISPYWLRLSDIRGSHTIPYIQSGRNLDIQIDFGALPPSATNACVELRCEGEKPRQRAATRTAPMAPFSELPAGEHSLTVTVKDEAGTQIRVVEYRDIGVGAVVAALGDSLTEGYNGHGFNRSSLDLAADDFPNDAVSADGRNFPQFSPTTAHHRP